MFRLPNVTRFLTRNCSTKCSLAQVLSAETNGNLIETKVKVEGWVKAMRNQKDSIFLDLDDGLKAGRRLQVFVDKNKVERFNEEQYRYHSAVSVLGILRKSSHPAQEFEIEALEVESLNAVKDELEEKVEVEEPEGKEAKKSKKKKPEKSSEESSKNLKTNFYPFGPRKKYQAQHKRTYPHFRAKLNDFSALLRIRNEMSQSVHSYFQNEDFIHIHTPILTGNDCEGGGEVFEVRPDSDSGRIASSSPASEEEEEEQLYFGKKVCLTVSGQLHLEAVCNGLSKVYNFNPAFRAEPGVSRRHLSEFYMIEAEEAFVQDLDSVTDRAESLIKAVLSRTMER